jgi:thiamine kinase-like enzyme
MDRIAPARCKDSNGLLKTGENSAAVENAKLSPVEEVECNLRHRLRLLQPLHTGTLQLDSLRHNKNAFARHDITRLVNDVINTESRSRVITFNVMRGGMIGEPP